MIDELNGSQWFHRWTANDEFWAFEMQSMVAFKLSPQMARIRSSGFRLLRPNEELKLSCRIQLSSSLS